jgi:tetratricopeptide (TPR) repeat protein
MPAKKAARAAEGAVPAQAPRAWTCGLVIVLATVAVYRATFSVPLLFDDVTSISSNPTIRRLATAFWPPPGTTVSGRPVLNLSFALNYAISGNGVWSYHAVNLAIHLLAGLVLFGIVRRTLEARLGQKSTVFGFAVALLWALHPILTESVTYVVQRAESLMGLFYLSTLYCFVRGASAGGTVGKAWFAGSIAACALGMGTKEVMATAPLVVLMYDRTFLARGFRSALQLRRWLYAGLAATWLPLFSLVFAAHGRGGSAGFASGISWWRYALEQLPAIVRYLRLSLLPYPLIFDYGATVDVHPPVLIASAMTVAVLLAASLWAMVKRPEIGFLSASFFVLLAPSSSIVPVATEAMAEHRMYLPLIPIVVLVVAGIYRWTGRFAGPIWVIVAASLSFATMERNEDYRSEETIWSDTVDHRPENERAQDNLGYILSTIPGRTDQAIAHYMEALRLKPDFIEAHYNLAYALLSKPGRLNEAIAHYEEALRLNPNLAEVQFNLARALEEVPGRTDDSVAHYEAAIRLRPDYAEAHYNLGYLLRMIPGRSQEAVKQLEEFVQLRPGNVEARYILGRALQDSPGRMGEAITQYGEAVRMKPDFVEARCNLGNALNSLGRTREAIDQYSEAARLAPNEATVHLNFAIVLLNDPARRDDAIAQLREAVRLEPGNETARRMLGRIAPAAP